MTLNSVGYGAALRSRSSSLRSRSSGGTSSLSLAASGSTRVSGWHEIRRTVAFARLRTPWLVGLVESTHFESFLGVLILANSVAIGLEVHMCPPAMSQRFIGKGTESETCPSSILKACEHFFTAVFLTEFFLRFYCYGWDSLSNIYRIGDAFLVWVTGVLLVWVLEPLQATPGNVRVLTVLRAFRLLRVARVVRMNPTFKEMWLLLKGLADSMSTLLWTAIVLLFMLFLFAVFAVILVGDSVELAEASAKMSGIAAVTAKEYFRGLDAAMFTLLQVVTGDAWASHVARPIMRVLPWMWPYFVLLIAVGTFVLLNLITAVIVDNAMQMSKADEEYQARETKKKRDLVVARIKNIFEALDVDCSGTVDEEEFSECLCDPATIEQFKLLKFEEKEIESLWRDLDDRAEGHIEVEAFADGMRKMTGPAMNIDTVHLQKIIDRLHLRLDRLNLYMQLERAGRTQAAHLKSLQEQLQRVQRERQEDLAEIAERLDALQRKRSQELSTLAELQSERIAQLGSSQEKFMAGIEHRISLALCTVGSGGEPPVTCK